MEHTVNTTVLETANYTGNYTILTEYDGIDQKYIEAARLVRNVGIPLISFFGLFGNTMSLLVFSTHGMRRSRCSAFLAALALVDNLFIISLLITWIDGEFVEILTSNFFCQCNIYLTYVCSFLSAWFVVCLTCERFIAIRFPFQTYIFSRCKEIAAVLTLAILACGLYMFSFWTVTTQHNGLRNTCVYRYQYMNLIEFTTWMDAMLTLIAPFAIIILFDSMVLHRAITRNRKYGLTRRVFRSTVAAASRTTFKRDVKRERPLLRVTGTILIVSMVFLCLNLPSHIVRIYQLIHYASKGKHVVSLKWFFIQDLTLIVYYISFSCNFFIYSLVGRNFKTALRALLSCDSIRDANRQRLVKRLSFTHGSVTVTSINISETSLCSRHEPR